VVAEEREEAVVAEEREEAVVASDLEDRRTDLVQHLHNGWAVRNEFLQRLLGFGSKVLVSPDTCSSSSRFRI
jgi:hypothetical protein